jgi:hypothetical protein
MKGMTTYDKAVYPTISCKVDNKGILRKIKRYRETGEITPPVEKWPALTNEDQMITTLDVFTASHQQDFFLQWCTKQGKKVVKKYVSTGIVLHTLSGIIRSSDHEGFDIINTMKEAAEQILNPPLKALWWSSELSENMLPICSWGRV